MKVNPIAGMFVLFFGAAIALAGSVIGPRKEDVPKYLQQMKAPNAKDRAVAVQMIGKRGLVRYDDVESAIEPIKRMVIDDSDPGVRSAAAIALGNIHPEPKDTVPVLIMALKKEKEELPVKLAVSQALSAFGKDARAALPELKKLQLEVKDKGAAKQLQASIAAISGKKK